MIREAFIKPGLTFWLIAVMMGFVFGVAMTGCATSSTKQGATLVDKIHDDETALKQVEGDIKAQCGVLYSPVGVLAGELLALAADAYAGNVMGAVMQAFQAMPGVVSDAKAVACVVKVVSSNLRLTFPSSAK